MIMSSTATKQDVWSQMKWYYISVVVIVITCKTATASPVPCENQNQEQLSSQLEKFRNAQLSPTLENYPQTQHYRLAEQLEYPFGTKTCPSMMSTAPNQPLADRSTCPWHHRINHDPTRYPTNIAEAYCVCNDTCRGSDINKCEPVFYKLPVLRQTGRCISGVLEYEHAWQTVATGCTCAQPKTALRHAIGESGPEMSITNLVDNLTL